MKELIISMFLILFVICIIQAGEERGVQGAVKYLDKTAVVGKQYLFLIGIDKYNKWLPLQNPVKDIKEIRDILLTHYYIDEVFELYDKDATKSNIIKTFKDLQSILEIHDSLLVVYTGHGHLDKSTNTGFWIPVNAGTDTNEQKNWLPNVQIRGLISNMKSIHVLLIVDSCFSGDILTINRALPGAIDAIETIDNAYFSKAFSKVSRQVLTSGAVERVPDDSQFARALKLSLKKNTNTYLDTLMLFNEIRLGVTKTSPMMGSLKDTGHQEGASFLLFKRQAETAVKTGDEKEDHAIENISIENTTKNPDSAEQETAQSFFSFHLSPGVSIPVLESAEKFSVGGCVELNGVFTIMPPLYIDLHAVYNFMPIQTVDSNFLSLIGGGTGIGISLNLISNLNISIYGRCGYFYAFANSYDISGSNPYISFGTHIHYKIMRQLSVGLEGAFRKYFYLYNDILVSLGLIYLF